GRLPCNGVVAAGLELIRIPARDRGRPPSADGPLLPEPPVELVVDRFAMNEFVLGDAVAGVPARISAEGATRLGDASQGLTLTFRVRRLDAEGRAAVELAYVPQTNRLALNLSYAEPEGGLAARLMDLPGLPPVELSLQGDAPLANFDARLRFSAGDTIGADGQASVRRTDEAYRIGLNFDAHIDGLMPPTIAPIFAGTTRLTG